MATNRDFAKALVDQALGSLSDRTARLIQDSGMQRVTITKVALVATIIEVYKELRSQDSQRWPEIPKAELSAAGARAYAKVRAVLSKNPKGKAISPRSITQLVSDGANEIVFSQTKFHQPFFRRFKSIWIHELDLLVVKQGGRAIETVKSTAESMTNEQGVIDKQAFGAALASGNIEDHRIRNLNQRLHVNESTVASLRTAFAINSLANFMGWASEELELGDVLSQIAVNYKPTSSAKQIVASASKGSNIRMAYVGANAKGAFDTDDLRERLTAWLEEALEKKGGKILAQGSGKALADEYGNYITKHMSVQIAGSKFTMKKAAKLSTTEVKKVTKPKSTSNRKPKIPPSRRYVDELNKKEADSGDNSYLASRAEEIKRSLIIALRNGNAIREHMGIAGALVNRTGRFANTVEIENVRFTPVTRAVSVQYEYRRYEYGTFEPGRAQGSVARDPHALISKTIRQIAVQLASSKRFRDLQLSKINIRRPVSG